MHVRPEQVVEIAFDGVQRSTRYPGGVALRFARVVRYRDDKTADEADTITMLASSCRRALSAQHGQSCSPSARAEMKMTDVGARTCSRGAPVAGPIP